MRDLFRYPAYHPADASYDEYWAHRDMGALNEFQRARADYLLTLVHDGDSVLDVGCGDARTLVYLREIKPSLRVSGVDSSVSAIALAKRRGIHVAQADIRDQGQLGGVQSADWIILYEVLEHMNDSETLLAWAVAHAMKGVVFSVPNTGFIIHRLRLLLGRFPLQWKSHPAEHVRFWTVRDMRWWLCQLGYSYQMYQYEGVPLLGRLWGGLFAAGIIIEITP